MAGWLDMEELTGGSEIERDCCDVFPRPGLGRASLFLVRMDFKSF